MNIFTILKISFNYFRKNFRRYLAPIVIISVSILIFNIFFSSAVAVTDSLKSTFYENKNLTLIDISSSDIQKKLNDSDLDKIKDINHVTDSFPEIYMSFSYEVNKTESIDGFYNAVSNIQYPVLKENELCTNCVLISSKLQEKLNETNKGKVGDIFEIFYNSVNAKCEIIQAKSDLKIIGILDTNDINFEYDYVIATSPKIFRDVYVKNNADLCITKSTNLQFDGIKLHIDDISNLNEVLNSVQNTGYRSDYALRGSNDLPNLTKSIILLGSVLFFIVAISGFINIISIINENLKSRIREFAIWKSLGCKNSELYLMLYFELLFISIVSFIVSELFFEIALHFLNQYFLVNLSLGLGTLTLNNSVLQFICSFLLISLPIYLVNISKITRIASIKLNLLLKNVQ